MESEIVNEVSNLFLSGVVIGALVFMALIFSLVIAQVIDGLLEG